MLTTEKTKLEIEVGNDIKVKLKQELGYDSDLVIDEQDEKRLDAMPELDREQEIDERRRRRDIL